MQEKCLIASSSDKSIQIWDLNTRQLRVRELITMNESYQISFVKIG